MSPEKAKIKAIVAEELGRDIEELANLAHDKVFKHQGGKDAFELGAAKVSGLAAHVDKDLEMGVIAEVEGEPLKIANYVKRYIKRCVGVLDNLATAAEIATHQMTGREQGLRAAAQISLKMVNEEVTKLEALSNASESDVDGRGRHREKDGSPAPTLKSQRGADAVAEPAQKEPKQARRKASRKSTPKKE